MSLAARSTSGLVPIRVTRRPGRHVGRRRSASLRQSARSCAGRRCGRIMAGELPQRVSGHRAVGHDHVQLTRSERRARRGPPLRGRSCRRAPRTAAARAATAMTSPARRTVLGWASMSSPPRRIRSTKNTRRSCGSASIWAIVRLTNSAFVTRYARTSKRRARGDDPGLRAQRPPMLCAAAFSLSAFRLIPISFGPDHRQEPDEARPCRADRSPRRRWGCC